ncbi:hydroxymethylglutaryl-CoA lyase [Paraburkholderia nemoris]|uniref:3-hydroxy-3-isohexenylglutaryl-CoA/hydroxy-methylglutaryl-CoA lyase n=1 Tax=Paraburkholderia nemoris TaxID=2793076 RepID=A0ABM8RDM9_9BURK|nr:MULTISPECIES: hydroxymethylglutaryl-CoA lyase [Paraburkholderia]CAE6746900.1 3-hydroxy-3-isohexenylglutaryl-CoA/hydroxy-methylglutaryl-CoA lyase [Paraburkholderia nemoris]CAE6748710.1 3-hydroxy-3-isohexenylglutaryl-CoA/hydroxy-methylglutaryl-CoA lyase [Paraburkholderia nemoris]CAE6802587.1 3-hydroxy-3-isohexenylglutaryl-CoA/hydroxy-methylglutaryl-CoA lyase [Paraburkholderia nemoris]CAE6900274.1 3-hydroxy-3-isohexenylglutaryl-CoA/hydroxy-methylglutaryl-CoA lyase [Paraburkholderia nemoris]
MNQQERWREGMGSGLPKRVHVVEVGPRDGLQAESTFIPTDTKIELVNRLVGAGIQRIEAASFVSPKWIPQMADGAQVMAGIDRAAGVSYAALTPNMRGLEAAIESKVDEVVIFGAASEAFSIRNINCSVAESLERFAPVARAAKETGLRLRASISCSFGCPYQGPVSVDTVVDMVRRFRDLGCDEIDIADTIGVGTAHQVQRVVEAAAREFPLASLAGHFHDTYGQALATIFGALQVGMTKFHASVGGLGGCPYAKGATGNVATEDLLYLLDGLGIETGIDLDAVVSIGDWVSQKMGRENGARAGKALMARQALN